MNHSDPPRVSRRVSRRVNQISISPTKEMPILAARIGGCVSLGQGVPSFPTPSHIVEAVCRALRDEPASGKYSLQPGMPELREALAAHLETERNIIADPGSEIAITVGAMEALVAAVLTVVERGDEVILPAPTYASHIEQVLLAEGTPVFVPLREHDWGLDVEAVRRAVTPRTRAVLVCNPSNPTGAVFADSDMRALCDLVLEHDLVLISDETYDFLVYDGPAPVSPASFPELKQNLISVSSFSKKYALTGWRIGWVTASAEWLAEVLKVHDATAICAPTPSQHAALAALRGPQQVVEDMRSALARRRSLCCRRLDTLSGWFSYVRPGGAFYVMARHQFSDAPSRSVALSILNEARVITIPGGSFGPGGEGHLRLSFGGTEDELNESFDRIERWLRERG